MKCKALQKELNAYLDGELPQEMSKNIEEHLAQCPGCREEVARHRKLRQLLDLVPGMEVPLGFARAVRARAERGASDAEKKIIPLYPARSPILARAAAMVAIVFGLTVGGLMSSSVAHARRASTETTPAVQTAEQSEGWLTVVPPGSVAEAYLQVLSEEE